MNGIHDMGGTQNAGPLLYEKNEPVFHAPWEGRVFAIQRAMSAWRKWTLDHMRHEIELIPPADYMRMSYYERWLTAITELTIKSGLITREELQGGTPLARSSTTPPLKSPDVSSALRRANAARPEAIVSPRFQTGARVRTRNIHPIGHSRLPRYARSKIGTIHRDHGIYAFPDSIVAGLGENPQHLYSVRFEARELWGTDASPRDSVYLDLWDGYLEQA